jgi:tetratricopeptide (TPR) repeat protein
MTAGAAKAFARLGRCARLLLLGWAVLAAGTASASDEFTQQTLEPIDALLASQAWQLALRSIDAAQRDAVTAQWQDLERRRLLAYAHLPDVAALSDRVAKLPADTPVEFRRWALTQLLEAAFAAHDLTRAQAALDQLSDISDAVDTKLWRVRLVRAYADSGQLDNALSAFAPLAGDSDARALRAELLVRGGHAREAFETVAGLKSPEAALWRVIAAKQLGLYAADDVVRELALLVRKLKGRADLQRIAWLVRADAAGEVGQLARRVNSLEQAFRLDPKPAAGVYPTTPDDLWSAYFAFARHIAETEDLSVGPAAIARADAYRKGNPYAARALYAWSAVEANSADVRAVAQERLVAALSAGGLDAVTRALYPQSTRMTVADVPDAVRRALMTEALARHDLPAAAKFARDLDAAPPDMSERDWTLRRARLMLYGGEEKAAVELLDRLVTEDDFDVEFARRYLQVVFDLQAMNEHGDALRLLDSVYTRVDDADLHRELLFWEAQSAAALKHYANAAALYLRSARFGGKDGSDRWGQSARYRAADVLAKGGMTKDAEAVYRGLLKETPDPDQRVLIEQNIERLWLAGPARTTP